MHPLRVRVHTAKHLKRNPNNTPTHFILQLAHASRLRCETENFQFHDTILLFEFHAGNSSNSQLLLVWSLVSQLYLERNTCRFSLCRALNQWNWQCKNSFNLPIVERNSVCFTCFQLKQFSWSDNSINIDVIRITSTMEQHQKTYGKLQYIFFAMFSVVLVSASFDPNSISFPILPLRFVRGGGIFME